MDDATAAAIAAVIIAILAMLVAMAQAIQQYFITGQLIRICDCVVYGKMPGKGSRMWAGSQFRFRVVYTIPHICLRPDLWEDGYKHHSELVKQRLPDLRNAVSSDTSPRVGQIKRTAYSAIPGEASWASFCRVMQYTANNELVYELVEGDADRCPADLPVVPMLVSLRDIVTIALTAGMTCTNASFTDKTIAMEGQAGTITSSVHPILGALLRFTPKNFDKPPGIRVCNGMVNSDWMARMWDVVVVAGRRYSSQDRKYYAAYESENWMLSMDMAIVRYLGNRRASRGISPVKHVRRGSLSGNTAHEPHEAGVLPKSPQDGDWSFETEGDDARHTDDVQPVINQWRRRVLPDAFATLSRNHSLGQSPGHRQRSFRQPLKWSADFAYKARGRDLLDGTALQDYIEEKRRYKSDSPVRDKMLLLPSFPGEGAEYDDWHRLYAGLSHERAMAFAQRWRDVVEKRQKRRERHDLEDESARTSRQNSKVRSSSQVSRLSRHSHRSEDEPRGRRRERNSAKARDATEQVTYGEGPLQSMQNVVPRERSHSAKRSASYERSLSHERVRGGGIRKAAASLEPASQVQQEAHPDELVKETSKPKSVQIAAGPAVEIYEAEAQRASEDSITAPNHISRSPTGEPRSILRQPRAYFPEDPNPVREGVAPLRDRNYVPRGARWTKIDRRLVSPEALIAVKERFEEQAEFVIVLRVLTREEIEGYATLTSTLRDRDGASRPPDNSEEADDDESSMSPESAQRSSEAADTSEGNRAVRFGGSPEMIDRFRSSSRERLRSTESSPIKEHSPQPRVYSPSGASYRSGTIDVPRSGSPMLLDFEESDTDGLVSSTAVNQLNGNVNWFWICQADVLPGYFATPWQNLFSASTCSGAIAVMMTALEWYADDSSLCYESSFPHCETWICEGHTTHPSYAINAMGGIVVSARYKRVKFEVLDASLPPIQLLKPEKKHTAIQQLSELMALDSWLSLCGRLPEIYNGRSNLIRRMPALVQKLMGDFAYEFSNVDRTAAEGGWQLMKEMADLILHELDQLMLEEAEQLFTLVAMLRAAKMAACIVQGPSTEMLQEILLKDAQVYMV